MTGYSRHSASTVRRSLGYKMIGDSSDAVWGVMDVSLRHPRKEASCASACKDTFLGVWPSCQCAA
jgi:hypothetical protein